MPLTPHRELAPDDFRAPRLPRPLLEVFEIFAAHNLINSFKMAKTPSKKTAKTVKAATEGKKKRRASRHESYRFVPPPLRCATSCTCNRASVAHPRPIIHIIAALTSTRC